MKRTLILASLITLASATAAFAASPTGAKVIESCCAALAACCGAGASCCP